MIGSLFGFNQSEATLPTPPTTQKEVQETSSPQINERVVVDTQAQTATSIATSTALDPLIAQVLRDRRPTDVMPDCAKNPSACELNVSKEVAIEKMISLKVIDNFDPKWVKLSGGSTNVDPTICTRGGGELNQAGFFWKYLRLGFDGLVQVNVATGETGVCLWPIEVSF